MTDWIPFGKGKYLVEQAFIVAPDHRGIRLDRTVVEVYHDTAGQRRMKGSGFVVNLLLVELLDDNETVDLVLDLGGPFKFRMGDPEIRAGKVFSPGVRALCQFAPRAPGLLMAENDFEALVPQVSFLDP